MHILLSIMHYKYWEGDVVLKGKKMRKLIIVEGPMKVGKSHFIRDLKQSCDEKGLCFIDFCSDVYRDVFINNFNESPTLAQRKAFDLGRVLGLKALFDNFNEESLIVVMDRFHLTNAIYAEAFSRGRQEYVRTVEEALKKHLKGVDIELVILADSAEGIESRLQLDERNKQYTIEDVKLLQKYFSDFFELSTINTKYWLSWRNRERTISELTSERR